MIALQSVFLSTCRLLTANAALFLCDHRGNPADSFVITGTNGTGYFPLVSLVFNYEHASVGLVLQCGSGCPASPVASG